MYQPCAPRQKKTDIVRKRTGCQNCRKRRRKCDEARPECQACVRRGVKCSGYQRTLAFKDVSDQTAELSRKFEAARWAQLREEDDQKGRKPGSTKSEQATPPSSNDDGFGKFSVWETVSPQSFAGFDSPASRGRGNSVSIGSGATSGGEPTPDDSTSPSGESLMLESSVRSGSMDAGGVRGNSVAALSDGSAASLNFQFEQLSGHISDGAISPSAMLFPENEGTAAMDLDLGRRMSLASSTLDDTFSLVDDVSLSSSGQESFVVDPSVQLIKRSPGPHSPMNDPLTSSFLSAAPDANLYTHFEQTVLKNFPVPFTFRHRYVSNNCFRLAILALSSANLSGLQRQFHITTPSISIYDEPTTRAYYLSAVRELHQQLQLPDPPDREALGAAAIILAYYEMEIGTPHGTMNHSKGVDAILSKLDRAKFSAPEVFKAWRLLRYDTKNMTCAYRKSAAETDDHAVYSMLDPQLAIRDIFISLSSMTDRWTMEVCFPPDTCPPGSSPSGEAAKWIRSVLLRKCDSRNVCENDFHAVPLTREEILANCDRYAAWLDRWHSALDYAGLPSLKLGNEQAFITGPDFDAILPATFSDHGRGFEYLLYVAGRMYCNYLRSLFLPYIYPASMTESWAKLLLGVVAGMDKTASLFTTISPLGMVVSAALLTEGIQMLDAVMKGVLPHMVPPTATRDEKAHWTINRRMMELIRKEKCRGRSLRMVIHGFDDDFERGSTPKGHRIAAFGDWGGKGVVRESYVLEWPREEELGAEVR